ncbi:MAG: sterol desaturase family protein [Asticcacaulis sp.]|uniref:sterol desaturase family protein n=1 Tax=Asticcacaulis sp. TaxID=1872648 RepID=UPI0039E2D20C
MTHNLYHGVFIWVALAFVIAEALYIALVRREAYDVRQTAASLGVAVGNALLRPVTGLVIMTVFPFVAQFAPWHLSMRDPWVWIAGFLGFECLYYWMHRFSHTIRWMWVSHAVHHSANSFNLPAAMRLGWTGVLSCEWLAFLPMVLLGFSPLMVVILLSANLTYQFFLHTELSPKWGVLEQVLNTPAHHRIHHASNLQYLDRNFGGVLIVFDRWFGTFAEDDRSEPVVFGLTTPIRSYNPFVIALREWGRMWRDLKRSRSVTEAALTLFGRPK